MSLLITTEKDLHLLQKQKLDEKLNRLSQTISVSFANKIDGPNGEIEFSNEPDQTAAVKVNFGKIKDHLLSKIREARDTSFYNSLEGYFKEYFNLIKFPDQKKRMTKQDYDQFMERINDLNTQLGIVYEPVYPEEYVGYRLMMVDRTNLDGPKGAQAGSGSLTGTLMQDPRGRDCNFTGQLKEIEKNYTFRGIDKHSQIKYVGGREYYFSPDSPEQYGAIYLQGDIDEAGTKRGDELRKMRAKESATLAQGNYEDSNFGSETGSYDDSRAESDVADLASLRTFHTEQPTAPESKPRAPEPGGEEPIDVSNFTNMPAESPVELRKALDPSKELPKPLPSPENSPKTPLQQAPILPEIPPPSLPPPVTQGPSSPLSAESPTAVPAVPTAVPAVPTAVPAVPAAKPSTATEQPQEGGRRRKKHKKSKKYYKKTRARKRKKTKKR